MKSLSTLLLACACATVLSLGACDNRNAGDHDADSTAAADTTENMDMAPDSGDVNAAPTVVGENTAEDTAETRREKGDMDTVGDPHDSNGLGDGK